MSTHYKFIYSLFYYIYILFSVASPGSATEQLMTQGAFKIRSGQVGTPMIQNGDPNRE